MNKKGLENRSVRNTRKKLQDGLIRMLEVKPLNEISVRELTELVDVNRGTFYSHYTDIYDLLRQMEDDFFAQLDTIMEDYKGGDQGTGAYPYLAEIFSFLGDNRELCRVLLGPNGDIQFVERVKGLVDSKCSFFWRQVAPEAPAKRFQMYNAFIINGCVGLVQNWLNGGLGESPEEMSRFAATLILASLAPCIQGEKA